MMIWRKIVVLVGCIGFLGFVGAPSTQAQSQAGWSPISRISDGEVEVGRYDLVADPYGYAHAFWVESNSTNSQSVIQHARFDGESWSAPLDIYLSPFPLAIGDLDAFVDHAGMLHLVWVGAGEKGPFFYSQSPAHATPSAKNWSPVVRINVPAFRLGVQVDSRGIIHVVYAQFHDADARLPGMYYMRSADQGNTWSDPYWLDPDIPPTYAPRLLDFAADEKDRLHLVWHQFKNSEEEFVGKEVRYIHSPDGGLNWTMPITIDEPDESADELRLAAPVLAVSGDEVHIVWAGNNELNREHRISHDAGATWYAPTRIFGDLQGQAFEALITDAPGRIHYIGQIRWPKAIYHAYWNKGQWIGPRMAYLIQSTGDELYGERIHAHNMAPAIRGGNQLVVLFHPSIQDPGTNEDLQGLWTIHRTFDDLLPSAAVPIPTTTPPMQPSPQVEVLPTRDSATIQHTPVPFTMDREAVTAQSASPADILVAGVLPSSLAVVGLIAFQVWWKRKHPKP